MSVCQNGPDDQSTIDHRNGLSRHCKCNMDLTINRISRCCTPSGLIPVHTAHSLPVMPCPKCPHHTTLDKMIFLVFKGLDYKATDHRSCYPRSHCLLGTPRLLTALLHVDSQPRLDHPRIKSPITTRSTQIQVTTIFTFKNFHTMLSSREPRISRPSHIIITVIAFIHIYLQSKKVSGIV